MQRKINYLMSSNCSPVLINYRHLGLLILINITNWDWLSVINFVYNINKKKNNDDH